MSELTCFQCAHKHTYRDRLGFREECERCQRDLHICRNCEFYDPNVYNECREPAADRVVDKEKFNRCEYFRPGARAGGPMAAAPDLRAAAEALFKKKP